MWRTPATESWYSFYQMGWVNSESERTAEINFRVGFEPTTSWSTVQRVTTELPPLSLLSHSHSTSDIFSPTNYVLEWDFFQWILSYRHNHCIDKNSYVLLHKIVAIHKLTLHHIYFAIPKRIQLNFTRQVDGDLCVLCREINLEIYEVRKLLGCLSV